MCMVSDSTDTREQGIEFGPLAEKLENESYPINHEELLSRHGDNTLEFEDGSATLREVLGPEEEREFEDAESVRQAIFAMSNDEAVGRDEYSDRGGTTPDENESEEADTL